MKLFIDSREKGQVRLLRDVCEEVLLAQLPIGDYLIVYDSDAALIERKTVTDFLSSIRSNRLWDQLLRMMKTEKIFEYRVKRRILLIQGNFEGYFERFNQGQKSEKELLTVWSQLMGAYLEIIFVYNTPIIHAESDLAFKAFMRIFVKRESGGVNDKLPDAKWYRKPVKADLPIKDRKKYILASIPYIGDRLAENLLLHFNTISEIASASKEELREVPKIGKKKAEIIFQMFHS